MTDEEAKTLGATHFLLDGFGSKRYYAFMHGGWWLLAIDDEWYPDYRINPKDKLELIE